MVRDASNSSTSLASGVTPRDAYPSRTEEYAKDVFQKLETNLDADFWAYLKEKITYNPEDSLSSLTALDAYLEENHIESCCPGAITHIFAVLFGENNPHAPENVDRVVSSQYFKGITLIDVMRLQLNSWGAAAAKPHKE